MEVKEAFEQINAGNNLSLYVPYESITNGKEYKGTVKFRFPSVKDEIMIGLEEAKLRGTIVEIAGRPELITVAYEDLDRVTQYLVEGLATLKVLCVQFLPLPDKNFKFEDLPQEVIVEINRGYIRAKNSIGKKPDESDSTDTTDESSQTPE